MWTEGTDGLKRSVEHPQGKEELRSKRKMAIQKGMTFPPHKWGRAAGCDRRSLYS